MNNTITYIKTKDNQYKRQQENEFNIYNYIIDAIDNSGYSDTELKTPREKVQFLKDTFESEYYPGKLSNWLQGLPSSISLPFNYCDIIELAKRQGTLNDNSTDKEIDKILDNYWNYISMKISELFTTLTFKKSIKLGEK